MAHSTSLQLYDCTATKWFNSNHTSERTFAQIRYYGMAIMMFISCLVVFYHTYSYLYPRYQKFTTTIYLIYYII